MTKNAMPLDIHSLLTGKWPELQQLLTGCFGEGINGTITSEQLMTVLQTASFNRDRTLLDNLAVHIGRSTVLGNATLNADSHALATFVDQLFNNYHKNNRLHPSLQPLLDQFRPAALLSLCRRRLPWSDSESPVRYLVELLPNIIGWQPELGRAAEKFSQQLAPLLEKLAAAGNPLEQTAATGALEQFFETEQQRINKLEQRLRDAEIGQLHARHAQQLSAKTLNQQMAGKKLPATIAKFLQGPWRESLRLVILGEGRESEAWRRMVRLTETLIWSFQPIDDNESPERRQHVYQSISELSEALRDTTIGLHHSSELDEQLAQVEAEHLKILKGQSLEYASFELIDNTDPLTNAQVSVSNSLIRNVASLEQGQWFLYYSDQNHKRIKLTIKIDQAQQLLFTNFLGIKSAQFNFEEFAYLLSSKIIVPLPDRDRFKATGDKMLQNLLLHYQQQQQTIASEKVIAEERQQREETSREFARQKALEEARVHAAAAEKAQEQVEQQALLHRQQRDRKTVLKQLAELNIGGRILFNSDDEEQELCRLAAILQSTGEYVFVNRKGVKKYTLNKTQLAEFLLGDKARIIDQGSNFENTLEQVVNTLRARKKS